MQNIIVFNNDLGKYELLLDENLILLLDLKNNKGLPLKPAHSEKFKLELLNQEIKSEYQRQKKDMEVQVHRDARNRVFCWIGILILSAVTFFAGQINDFLNLPVWVFRISVIVLYHYFVLGLFCSWMGFSLINLRVPLIGVTRTDIKRMSELLTIVHLKERIVKEFY